MQCYRWSLITASGLVKQSNVSSGNINSRFAGRERPCRDVLATFSSSERSGRFKGYHPIYAN